MEYGARLLLAFLSGGAALVSIRTAFEAFIDPADVQARAAQGLPPWFWVAVALGCAVLCFLLLRSAKRKA
jgi:hypothetical protein